ALPIFLDADRLVLAREVEGLGCCREGVALLLRLVARGGHIARCGARLAELVVDLRLLLDGDGHVVAAGPTRRRACGVAGSPCRGGGSARAARRRGFGLRGVSGQAGTLSSCAPNAEQRLGVRSSCGGAR